MNQLRAASDTPQPQLRFDERMAHILDLLDRQSTASLAEIQAITGPSAPTVRRDLNALEARGLLRRRRGGAILHGTANPIDEAFELRRRRNARAKAAIAVTAAKQVGTRTAIFLGDGSTATALAEVLIQRDEPLWVATTALNIAQRFSTVDRIEVVVIGGQLRGSSYGTVGPLAIAGIANLRADIAFLVPDWLDLAGPVFNNLADAEVAQHMARRSTRTIILADSSKYAPGGTAHMLTWHQADELITEAITPALGDRLAKTRTKVTLAPNVDAVGR